MPSQDTAPTSSGAEPSSPSPDWQDLWLQAQFLIPFQRGRLVRQERLPRGNQVSRGLVAALPILLGIWISADATNSNVRTSSTDPGIVQAFEMLWPWRDPRLQGSFTLDLTTVAFVLLSTYFVWLLSRRLLDEDTEARRREARRAEEAERERQDRDKRLQEVQAAILVAPDFTVINKYADYHGAVMSAVSEALPSEKRALAKEQGIPEKRAEAAHRLVLSMGVLSGLFESWDRHVTGLYRANIMLFVPAPECEWYPEEKSQVSEFENDGFDPARAGGMLMMRPDLIYLERGALSYPRPLVLPVPTNLYTSSGASQTLPGAPTALLQKGGFNVYNDTSLIADQATHLSQPVRDKVRQYFGDEGDGANIRSFVSLRLGPHGAPLGVLNVDADTTNLIGKQEIFYGSFLALVRPFLQLIRPVLTVYRDSHRAAAHKSRPKGRTR